MPRLNELATQQLAADLWLSFAALYLRYAGRARTDLEVHAYKKRAHEAQEKATRYLTSVHEHHCQSAAHQSRERCPLHHCPVTRPLV